MRLQKSIWLFLMPLLIATLACGSLFRGDGPPRNAVMIAVKANTSLGPWLEAAIEDFNRGNHRTDNNRPVYVELELAEAGQAVANITAGGSLPDLWIPDDPVWVDILADQGQSAFLGECISVAESPLVIAMWRPAAESLGWPAVSLGWLDIGSLAADPTSWAFYSGGDYGDTLRLGHTHPGLSASGVSAMLALVQAAGSKTEAVTSEDIDNPIVQASVSAFEAAVSWFSPSTALLGQTMRERGARHLGAAVMYESSVFYYGDGDPQIIPIYPFEGSFMATHPACINGNATGEAQEATAIFRSYLAGETAQRMAVEYGLRPVNREVDASPLVAGNRGVALDQPAIIFDSPTAETVYAVQDLWQAARKDVNMVMLLDISGSMGGRKMTGMIESAAQFVRHMGEDDYLTIITFSTYPEVLIYHERVGPARNEIIAAIEALRAMGYTALYDAIGEGAEVIAATTSPDTTNVMVILTDGMDTSSNLYRFDEQLFEIATANDTTVFTIAYGSDADESLMQEMALRGNGNYYLGDEANIAAIYEEMSAAFGGAVGVGR